MDEELQRVKMLELSRRITSVKVRMLAEHPFFGLLISRLNFAIDLDCQTACTDGDTVYFGLEFSSSIGNDELYFVLMHEVMHIVAGHCFRGENTIHRAYNIAADIVINSILLDELGLPDILIYGQSIMHTTPDGKEGRFYTAEEVYLMLIDNISVRDSGIGEGHSIENSGKDTDNKEEDNSRNAKSSKGNGKEHDGENTSGGGAYDEQRTDDECYGGFLDDHSRWGSKGDSSYNEAIWKQRIAEVCESLKNSQQYGSVPSMAQRQITELLNPTIDWRIILNDFVQQEINDYSFAPPDRRFSDSDFLLPDYNETADRLENIFIAVDASGSIRQSDLTRALSEIKGAIDQYGGKLTGWISYFDYAVSEPKPFESFDDILKIEMVGGGGTSFKNVIAVANQTFKGNLACIIFITDGFAEWPKPDSCLDVPILWILNNTVATPPFGKVCRMPKLK